MLDAVGDGKVGDGSCPGGLDGAGVHAEGATASVEAFAPVVGFGVEAEELLAGEVERVHGHGPVVCDSLALSSSTARLAAKPP